MHLQVQMLHILSFVPMGNFIATVTKVLTSMGTYVEASHSTPVNAATLGAFLGNRILGMVISKVIHRVRMISG